MQPSSVSPNTILDFWLGPLDEQGWAGQDRVSRWFKKNPAFDAELVERFMPTHQWLHATQPPPWQDTPSSTLAYILVLDQMSRNMFRGRPEMFASDPLALAATHRALEKDWDQSLKGNERVFLYMPLMHSESLEDQERCVQLFEAMHQSVEGPRKNAIASNVHFAKQHRDIIQRFGRFPHRNEVLARVSSDEEKEFLTQPGSSF